MREIVLRRWPEATLLMGARDDTCVSLELIEVPRVRRGMGTRIMREMVALASQRGIDLVLNAASYSPRGPSQEKLIAWYERFGFQAVSLGWGVSMERRWKPVPPMAQSPWATSHEVLRPKS